MNDNGIIYKILRRREARRLWSDERTFDSSAIADMAFLLLIFFIVTSSFILRQGIFLTLPSKIAGAVSMKPEQVLEVVPENKGFVVDGTPMDRAAFKKRVAEHNKNQPKGVLLVRMKGDVKYDRLVDALSVARETGLKRISLKEAGGGR